ncbi:TRP-domain-containing protein [Aspergillus ellipticus CBS 707.79]|uniref:TRP-domain-containing protein n=1 Tax=Aspergillus ellipticus CBS 707.79 TaxID=1448320 RepID=A0A319DRA9_9EURO|nr:TRP-domain-containing protein [Aspergillus ellipticus CBS 707.79]
MRGSWILPKCAFLLLLTALAHATNLIESHALSLCQEDSNVTVSYFSMVFTPSNKSVAFSFDGTTEISGKVTAEVILDVYGYQALTETLDPCQLGIEGLCPMSPGSIELSDTSITLSQSVINQIPTIGYKVPDLDATVRIYINSTTTGERIACVEANISNGKTVYQQGVGWIIAIMIGLALVASAIMSGLGRAASTVRLATIVLPFVSFMQSQAAFGMASAHMPPIVEAWTQNFQWTMGIIHVGTIQSVCTWYQRSTGGTASSIIADLSTTSVEVLRRKKRSLVSAIAKRASDSTSSDATVTVRGIERVGFEAAIELTNIFMTGVIFLVWFVLFVVLILFIFRVTYELLAKKKNSRPETVAAFRRNWTTLVKQNIFRLLSLGFLPMCILCPWELTQQDSPAEILLAIFVYVSIVGVLGWAAVGFIVLAKQSGRQQGNATFISRANAFYTSDWVFVFMNTWEAASYYIAGDLIYLFLKGLIVGLGQPSAVAQAFLLLFLEIAQLITTCRWRAWSDTKLRTLSIALASIQVVDALFLLIFSDVFKQPAMMSSVLGVIHVLYNAILTLVLIIKMLGVSWRVMRSKDVTTRLDRHSLSMMMDPMANELREMHEQEPGRPYYRDHASSISVASKDVHNHHLPPSAQQQNAPSPLLEPSVPLFPVDKGSPTGGYHNSPQHSPWRRGAGYED